MAFASYTQTDFPAVILYNDISAKNISITEVLPFRVRFTNIVIDPAGYNPINPAPIGIAVLGYNNYIL